MEAGGHGAPVGVEGEGGHGVPVGGAEGDLVGAGLAQACSRALSSEVVGVDVGVIVSGIV